MDYKIIILLFLFAGIIYLIIKETENIKKSLDDKFSQVINCIEVHSKQIKNKFQNDLGLCINKIKSINGEYMTQMRKMNDYQSQTITNMSNQFNTDTDSKVEIDKDNQIQYISDAREEIQTQDFYISDNKHSILNEKNKSANSVKYDDFKVIYSADLKKNVDNPTKSETKPKNNDMSASKMTSSKITESLLNDKCVNNGNDFANNSDDFVNVPQKPTFKLSTKFIVDDELTDESGTNISENENDENTDVNNTDVDNSESSNNDIDSKTSENKSHSSNFGEITLGSKIRGHKPSTAIQLDNNNDQKSQLTVESDTVNNLNVNNLKPIKDYNYKYLQKLATRLSIPISNKENDGSRKYYKKDMLYEKIKLHLENDNL